MKMADWTLAVTLLLALPVLAQDKNASAQNEAEKQKNEVQDNVLFLNAGQTLRTRPGNLEYRTCVVPRAWVSSGHACPGFPTDQNYSISHGRRVQLNKPGEAWKFLDEGYFIQGRRIELEVVNRKFQTDYSISIDGVTELQSGPNIRNLNEAQNLSLGTASFASIPLSKGGVEGLTPRTAAGIVMQLIDEETSSQPLADLNNDHAVIQREFAKLEAQIDDFTQHYDLVLGTNPNGDDNCAAVRGSPSVIPLQVCLDDEYWAETNDVWTNPPYQDEQEFRNVNTRVQDLIAAVNMLGVQLASTGLPSKLKAFETALAQYDNDVTIFVGNINAAKDAAGLMQAANGEFRRGLHREELRVLLLNKLKGPDSKPTLDEAEMNQLLDSFRGLGQTGLNNADALGARATVFETERLISDASLRRLHGQLDDFRDEMNVELPDAIDDLNQSQGKLLDRVNFIYDHSEVPDPLPKQIDLSGHSGNLLVYYSIRRIESFQRYSIAQVQEPGVNVQPSAGVMALPAPIAASPSAIAPSTTASSASTPASGANTNASSSMTTSATATASPSTSSAPTPVNGQPNSGTGNTGIVVAKGAFQVHELFWGNVVAAVAASWLKNQSVTKQAQPTSCKGTSTTPDTMCFSPVLTSSVRMAPIVGLDVYFQQRDSYPRTDRPWLCREHPRQCFGGMGAMSAIKANDYYIGGFFEPSLGVQITAGMNLGVHTALQKPYQSGVPVDINGNFPTSDQRGVQLFVGAGLDLGIFRKVFGKFTGIGTSTSSTSGQ